MVTRGGSIELFEIGRIRFRPLEKEDICLMDRWEDHHVVTLFARGKTLVFKAREEIKREYEEYLENRSKTRLIVELVEDSKEIGIATYKDRNGDVRSTDIGCYIGEPSYWNQGLGKEIALGFCEMLFYQQKYDRLSAWSSSVNTRAHSVLESVGFQLSGRARKSGYMMGKKIDWLMFDILREEYIPKRKEYLNKYLTEAQLETYSEDYCSLKSYKP
ncbi:MAG: GNAT family protein [Thermoplasmata archaeon]